MQEFKLIIFDLDGVLIDSISVMQRAFQYAYEIEVGSGIAPFDEYRKHLGKGFLDIMKAMSLPLSMHTPFKEKSNSLMGDVKIYNGVKPLLKKLQNQNIRLGIGTGKDGNRARGVLQAIGLLSFFDLVIGSDEVVNPKPHPDMLLKQLHHFNIPNSKTLFIGDSVSDLRAGKAAGIKTAAALWGYGNTNELLEENPDFSFDHPSEIVAITQKEHEFS